MGWEVHDSDHADHAAHVAKRTALAEGIAAMFPKPVLHGDNGSTVKGTTVLAMLEWLGVKPSYSRLRVSNDKDYVAYCTPSVRSSGSFESRHRCERLAPGFLRGAASPGGSYKDSFLSL